MGANGVGHGVVGPVIVFRAADAVEFLFVALSGAAVLHGVAFDITAAGEFSGGGVNVRGIEAFGAEVHGDGCVATLGPEQNPFGEGGSAAAVDQHNGREVLVLAFVAGDRAGGRVVGEDFRGAAFVFMA